MSYFSFFSTPYFSFFGDPEGGIGTSRETNETEIPSFIGDRRADGTIYTGVSPDTGRAMYTTPKDAPLTSTFDQAAKYAAKLNAHGHHDWRVPSKAELNVLFQNRAAIGGFNETGSLPACCYWSSSRDYSILAWAQRFSDGNQLNFYRGNALALRCVRG